MVEGFLKADEALKKEVGELLAACGGVDGVETEIFTDASMNFYKDMPCAYTYRSEGVLNGFAFVFAPTTEEIEVSAIVRPGCRRRGIFKAMLTEIARQSTLFQYKEGLLVCNRASLSGKEVISHWQLPVHHTEYQMELKTEALKPVEGYALKTATLNDVEDLACLGRQIFQMEGGTEEKMLRNSIESPGRIQWVFKKGAENIGLCAAEQTEDKCFIYGLGIRPEDRRKGYARIMLDLVYNFAFQNGMKALRLDVDSENPPALKLYRSYGFKDVSVTDYYTFELSGQLFDC